MALFLINKLNKMKNKLFLSIVGMIGISIIFGLFLYLFFTYFIGHKHNDIKICLDERYNEYMIKDLDSSRIYNDAHFVNMNHNTTVTLFPYLPKGARFNILEPLYPTMFEDSCSAKAYLKCYIK